VALTQESNSVDVNYIYEEYNMATIVTRNKKQQKRRKKTYIPVSEERVEDLDPEVWNEDGTIRQVGSNEDITRRLEDD
jgi:hypothetical protein